MSRLPSEEALHAGAEPPRSLVPPPSVAPPSARPLDANAATSHDGALISGEPDGASDRAELVSSAAPKQRFSMTSLFTLTFVMLGVRLSLARLSDNSFLWHLQTGHVILDHGFPRGDIYSFTAKGTPWVVQSWLAEVLCAGAERLLGGNGIRLLVMGIQLAITVGVLRLALRLAVDRIRAVLTATVVLAPSIPFWGARPLIFGLLAAVALLWILEVPHSLLGRRPLIAMPIVFWLWANAHGSFALGVAYVVAWIVGGLLDGHGLRQGREREIARALGVSLVAVLCNPYTWHLLWFPIGMLQRGKIMRNLIEWRSPDFTSPQGVLFAGLVAAFVICAARGRNRMTRRDLLIALPFLVSGLWAQRNILLAPIFVLPMMARAVATERDRPEQSTPMHRVLAIMVMGLTALFLVDSLSYPAFDYRTYPVRAIRAVERNGQLGSRLLTTDDWAGYLIHSRYPTQPVFIDDRLDMYPIPLISDFLRISDAGSGWQEILDQWRVETVVWPAGRPMANALVADAASVSPSWRLLYSDSQSQVFVRTRSGV